MTAFNIDTILESLSQICPIFHNEEDFQSRFAYEIQQQYPDFDIKLEYKIMEPTTRYIDVWIQNPNPVAIELKYKSSLLNTQVGDETFNLKNHSAEDLGRYDFLKDVQRLEDIVTRHPNAEGYAVMITNDPLYWKISQNNNTIDSAFRIHEGLQVTGDLSWSSKAGSGSTQNREESIQIKGVYDIHWKRYSNHKNNEFKILCLKITSLSE